MFSEFGLVTDSERADKAEQENKRLAEELVKQKEDSDKRLKEEEEKREAIEKQLKEVLELLAQKERNETKLIK